MSSPLRLVTQRIEIDPRVIFPTWKDLGECGSSQQKLAFIEGDEKAKKAICGQCAVQAQCLVYALLHPEEAPEDVWGGRTLEERQQILSDATILDHQEIVIRPPHISE